ncbi:MAG: 30S ribosomal protein S4e [Candidatus Aenigmatarchaeota archaeon]
MVKKHLKRLKAPKFWGIKRKESKYTVRPRSGPHKLEKSIPLQVLIRDILGIVSVGSDARKIIKGGEVFVDGKPRKDHKYPVGLMDVISLPTFEKNYRITINHNGLKVIECPENEKDLKIVRINNKTLVKKGYIQLNFHDGGNIIIPVKNPKKPVEDVYKTGDSLVINFKDKKIVQHLKFEKGSLALMTDGQNIGTISKIKEIIETRSREPNKVVCEKDGKEFEAIKDYVFVIGTNKPYLTVG